MRKVTLLGAVLAAALAAPAVAQDKVKVGVFPVSSSLPFFVAQERGFFKQQGIDAEMIRLIGGPPNVSALITNQIDASAVLVTIEGMNANLKKPGVAMYISVNSQNAQYQMEQFVVRKGLPVRSLADLKGKKLMSAPGPANVSMAKAVLAAAGLKEGDYTIDQLDMGQHVNAMTAGTFDGGYTLEPNAATMRKLGVATTLESGLIAKYILGDPKANAWVAGGVLSTDFIKNRPEVARRFAAAWGTAITFINSNPKEARKHLVKNTFTPDDVVATVPLVKFTNVVDLTAHNRREFQAFIDYSAKLGTLPETVDVTKYLQRF
jgi:NitT/TauT family transport system substrate-binding protein